MTDHLEHSPARWIIATRHGTAKSGQAPPGLIRIFSQAFDRSAELILRFIGCIDRHSGRRWFRCR